jgi:hypothetical protein
MNRLLVPAIVLLATLAAPTAHARDGRIALPDLTTLEDKASEVVDVTLDKALLGMASRFLSTEDPEEAAAKVVISGLEGVYVRSYEFDSPVNVSQSDVDSIRRQLRAPGWSRIVGARSRKENTNVEVYMLVEGNQAKGLAVLAIEPKQFTIVNIVGAVDLEKLHRLEGQFGVPKLDLEAGNAGKTAASR